MKSENANQELEQARRERAAQIIRDLQALDRPECADCGAALCGHEALLSWSMGLLGSTYCSGCLAQSMKQTREEFLEAGLEFVQRLDCWRAGWEWASRDEDRADEGMRPSCLWGTTETDGKGAGSALPTPTEGAPPAPERSWDAGDMACGQLLLELRGTLREMAPGQVLHLSSRDPASPEDLPAWCDLTGHTLLVAEHPEYWIRRREG